MLAVVLALAATLSAPKAAAGEGSPAAVTTAYQTVPLAHYGVTATSCGLLPSGNGGRFPGCVHADGGVRRPLRLYERVKAAFGGTVTLILGDSVDAVYVSYGRQPGTAYSTPVVLSTLPGSGTYDMIVTVKSHDEFAWHEVTYLVPLWVPRRT